jgi:hypothetical protein
VAAHNLLGTPTGHITAHKNDNTYYQVTTMADDPQVKRWGKQEKQLLAKLVKIGKVDLSCKNDVEYIDQVRFKYYRECDNRNFHQNFHNYVQEQELEDTVSGTCRKEQGIR